MNATLKTFGSTLAQVAARCGERAAPRTALVAGVLALALATPDASHAQVDASVSADKGVKVAVQGVTVDGVLGQGSSAKDAKTAGAGQGIGEAVSLNLGRVMGGIAGFTIGRANDASTAVTAVLTGLGVVGGGELGRVLHERWNTAPTAPAVAAPAASTSHSGAEPGPGKVLPVDIDARVLALTIDAAAWRRLAQLGMAQANALELQQAAAPRDAAINKRWRGAEAEFEQVMRLYKVSFGELRNAVNVASRQGFAVAHYGKALGELALPVDAANVLPLEQPAVVERAAEFTRERASLGELATDGSRNPGERPRSARALQATAR